jgi:ABC transporter substrate binding protein (PQQ-dependent alcohol dehydrogenase system)
MRSKRSGWRVIAASWALACGCAIGLSPAPASGQSTPKVSVAIDILVKERPIREGLAVEEGVAERFAPPVDAGLHGARLGLSDNRTAGRFLGHGYELTETVVGEADDAVSVARERLAAGARLLVLDVPAGDLLAIADLPEARGAVVFNTGAEDDHLRGADCRANVVHVALSRAMLADALAQFASTRKWAKWFLIVGRSDEDRAMADAYRRAAKKFGLRLVADTEWLDDAELRRAQGAEVPVFTQGADYDLVVVADEHHAFSHVVPYATWLARPVAGAVGLRPTTFHPTVAAWGAVQFQNRFVKQAGRPIDARDFSAWLAMRLIGEAVTRARSADPLAIRTALSDPSLEVAGFKGRKISMRGWDGQVRQPVYLAHPEGLTGQAPFEGFLHRRTELDSLGADEPETACRAFKG